MAWEVIRTEPIIVRLHCSLTQYLNGPGEFRFPVVLHIHQLCIVHEVQYGSLGNSEHN